MDHQSFCALTGLIPLNLLPLGLCTQCETTPLAFLIFSFADGCAMLCCAQQLSSVQLFATPWTVTRKASLSMGFSRQEYWRGLSCPPPGNPPDPGIKPRAPTLQVDSLPSEPPGKPLQMAHHWNPQISQFYLSCASINRKREKEIFCWLCISGEKLILVKNKNLQLIQLLK